MSQKIMIGNFPQGETRNRLPFFIDNNAFPILRNANTWRGRARRKRGTAQLGRLSIQLGEASGVLAGSVTLDSSPKTFNIKSGLSLPSTASFVKGSLQTITIVIGAQTFRDTTGTGQLTVITPGNITAVSLNYSTGIITITFTTPAGAQQVFYQGDYYSGLPAMGLRSFSAGFDSAYPQLLSFDTAKSYQLNQAISDGFYNVNYYKDSDNAFSWEGQDFQQFQSVNFEGALWATNSNPGLHYTVVRACANQTSTTITVTLYDKTDTSPVTTLVEDEWLFFNEGLGTSFTLNGFAGQITDDSGSAGGVYVVTFSTSRVVNTYTASSAIAFTLSSSLASSGDGIRWYDGDPTGTTGFPVGNGLGWVNFSPPLSAATVSFNDLVPKQYYLAGATAIVPFKDRLLFFAPYVMARGEVTPTLLEDCVIYSWDGTPYYSLPVPTNAAGVDFSYDSTAYQTDVVGKGGYLQAGIRQKIYTILADLDVLVVGFLNRWMRFVFTDNQLQPFQFFTINSEFGSNSTFSGVTMDQGGLAIGPYGIFATDQTSSQRMDLVIPDEVFNIRQDPAVTVYGNPTVTGPLRVNGARDYFREWIYWSYPQRNSPWKWPTRTLLFNYRENTFGVLDETYTCHGEYVRSTSLTWATLSKYYPTWSVWTNPWGDPTLQIGGRSVVAGNQQGFVMQLDVGTAEAPSLQVQAIVPVSGNPLNFTITSEDHCLANEDFVYFTGVTGTNGLEGKIAKVSITPADTDTFIATFNEELSFTSYLGGATVARLSRFFIQTKEFNLFWDQGRQTRLGVQKYLFDKTTEGQATVNIYLSTSDISYNSGSIWPDLTSINEGLVYTDFVNTSPEVTDLQQPTGAAQHQIWARMNTSLQGATVQIALTLSDEQMYDLDTATAEFALHAAVIDMHPGPPVS